MAQGARRTTSLCSPCTCITGLPTLGCHLFGHYTLHERLDASYADRTEEEGEGGGEGGETVCSATLTALRENATSASPGFKPSSDSSASALTTNCDSRP